MPSSGSSGHSPTSRTPRRWLAPVNRAAHTEIGAALLDRYVGSSGDDPDVGDARRSATEVRMRLDDERAGAETTRLNRDNPLGRGADLPCHVIVHLDCPDYQLLGARNDKNVRGHGHCRLDGPAGLGRQGATEYGEDKPDSECDSHDQRDSKAQATPATETSVVSCRPSAGVALWWAFLRGPSD